MMQHISTTIPLLKPSRGGRISSPKLRASIEDAESFDGLSENSNRYDLLLLVKKVGKQAGFTSKMIELLDYYISYTRDIDWEQGARPIIYQSLSKTALEMGVSERQIQNLEKALFEIGALTWNDSGNHKRFGQRCQETGMILYAYGVDLSPLAFLQAHLESLYQDKKLYQKAWMEAKRQISYYRRQIKSIIGEMILIEDQGREVFAIESHQSAYKAISGQIRSHMNIHTLKELIAEHKALFETLSNELLNCLPKEEKTQKASSRSEENFAHINITKHKPTNKFVTSSLSDKGFQESSSRVSEGNQEKPELKETSQESEEQGPIKTTGLHHITAKQALNVATEDFRGHIPLHPRRLSFDDLVEAAFKRKSEINIAQSSWVRACNNLTKYGAAICVLLTDKAMEREYDPVRNPGAYFNGMINKVERRELKLHKSIMGHLKSEYTAQEGQHV